MLELHALPGRIRVKNPVFYKDKALSQYINLYCENLYGVKYCRVSDRTATVLIVYDEAKTNQDLLLDSLKSAISAALDGGAQALVPHDAYFEAVARRDKAKKWFLIYGITYLLFKVKQAMYGKFYLSRSTRVLEVASLVTIIGGYPILKAIYKKITKRVPADSEILLKLAAVSLTLLRESAKGVFVLVLNAFNDYLKYAADVECMRTLRQSMGETSGMAYLLKDGREILVPADELHAGDMIAVHQGELVPAEGKAVGGSAVVNSLYHTGQPLVEHIDGDGNVAEGMAILSGSLQVRVAELPESSAKIDLPKDEIRLYRNIQEYSQQITWVSMGLAALHLLLRRNPLGAMSILLLLSPGASATAFSSGMKDSVSMLNKSRIYVRNPNVFDKIADVKSVVFDKTGTLTNGIMEIHGVELYDSRYTAPEFLKLCAACEADNYHPISVTLKEAAGGQSSAGKVKSSVYLPSKGVAAQYEGRRVLIGNEALMRQYGVDASKGAAAYAYAEEQLLTPVFVAIEDKLAGMILLQDTLRESAPYLIRRLKEKGVGKIALLTGDEKNKAIRSASKLGIETVFSGCTAEDKVRVIEEYRKDGSVMMVGDGVNDVAAMKAADVSVSFVDSSCDKVKLHSDCIIFENEMTRLADLILLSRKARRQMNQSFRLSNAFNLFFGAWAFFRYFDPFAAKSVNTVNSLVVLLLNQRINLLSHDRIRAPDNGAG
jgi:cation-transporting P-type ATPase C